MPEVAVLHIAREAYDFGEFVRFANSYNKYSAGIEHELVVVVKGLEEIAPTDESYLGRYRELLPRATFIPFGDVLFDLGCYAWIAKALTQKYVCFLNSRSEILADEWLAKFVEAVQVCPRAGIVGATGSWQEGLGLRFPNPHIRTNGFLMRRTHFLKYAEGWKFDTKEACNNFEHGPKGLSRQLERDGYELYVVDCDGKSYPRSEWVNSRTWRTSQQERLLLGDNRTREYHEVDEPSRRFLVGVTWYSFPTMQTLINSARGIPLSFSPKVQ